MNTYTVKVTPDSNAFFAIGIFDPDAVIERESGDNEAEVYTITSIYSLDTLIDAAPGVIEWDDVPNLPDVSEDDDDDFSDNRVQPAGNPALAQTAAGERNVVFYHFMIGPPYKTWADAQDMANKVSARTGHLCEPSYDSMTNPRQTSMLRANLPQAASMTVLEFRRLLKIATRNGWDMTVHGYVPPERMPVKLTMGQVEAQLAAANRDRSAKPAGKLARILGILRG